MKYKILHLKRSSVEDFQDLVNQELKEGWTPIGGIEIKTTSYHNVFDFFQAVVKK